MATETPPAGISGSESSRSTGASSNMSPIGTQQERRHQVVHRDTANAANKNMTQDAHFKMLCKTRSSKNKRRHAIGYEYIQLMVNGYQLTRFRAAGMLRELRDEFIAARNGTPSLWTKAFVCIVHEMDNHDVVSSVIFLDGFSDRHPREWTKQASITLEEATDACMVEVPAESYC